VQVDAQPDLWRDTFARIHAARRAGIEANGQVGVRPIGIVMGLETTVHPFATHAAWTALANLSPKERLERLAADEGLRRRLIEERPKDGHTRWMAATV